MKKDLISCICVTRGKPALLRRAIQCFVAQTYPNKELVVLCEDDDHPTLHCMSEEIRRHAGIRTVVVNATARTPLGELRNLAIRAAQGEYVCQWDDDDWYHADRLDHQYKTLSMHRRDGALMMQWIVFDACSATAYLSNVRTWEGSILCRKSILQQRPYEPLRLGEDTATIDYLLDRDHLHLIQDNPVLYIYIYHSRNTWNYEHWSYIFECSTALPAKDSALITAIINGEYPIRDASSMLDEMLERQSSRPKILPF